MAVLAIDTARDASGLPVEQIEQPCPDHAEGWRHWSFRLGVGARVEGVPWLRGFCAWLLYDFRSERRQTRFAGSFNRKGLIAENKITRKLAFNVLANWYREISHRRNGFST